MTIILMTIILFKGKVIGVCGGPFINPECAFIGLYAVRKEYMGRGIGSQLFGRVLEYIGDKNCCLFAVPDKLTLYRDKLGFKLVADQKMVIFYGKVNKNLNINNDSIKLELITSDLMEEVINYDQNIHNYRRDKLLKLSLNESECISMAVKDKDNKIVGFGSIKENSGGFAVLAPLYADNPLIAQQLIEKLIDSFEIAVNKGVYYYGINTNISINIALSLGLVKHEECQLLFKNCLNYNIDYNKIFCLLSPNF
jgi:hypothetical protein